MGCSRKDPYSSRRKFLPSVGGGEKNLFLIIVSVVRRRLLARVVKEGVQFWYFDTSTVKRSSEKPLKFTLLHVSICSKLVRNFSNTLGFVSLCRYASLFN